MVYSWVDLNTNAAWPQIGTKMETTTEANAERGEILIDLNTNAAATERGAILAALTKFACQKPGLEYGNYGNRAAYRAEVRAITATLHDARDLLRAVDMHAGISAADIKEGFGAYCGRLSWDGKKLDYCTGQYWPTEYRNAVCAVLTRVLWEFFRACAPIDTANLGDYIRNAAIRQLGRPLANRWF